MKRPAALLTLIAVGIATLTHAQPSNTPRAAVLELDRFLYQRFAPAHASKIPEEWVNDRVRVVPDGIWISPRQVVFSAYFAKGAKDEHVQVRLTKTGERWRASEYVPKPLPVEAQVALYRSEFSTYGKETALYVHCPEEVRRRLLQLHIIVTDPGQKPDPLSGHISASLGLSDHVWLTPTDAIVQAYKAMHPRVGDVTYELSGNLEVTKRHGVWRAHELGTWTGE
jgi:hypothetical protein